MSPKSSNRSNCPVNTELEPLLEAIRSRYALLTDEQCMRRVFLNRLRNLGRFGNEPVDYEAPVDAELPKELEIGFAVCHPECGNQAFVVVDEMAALRVKRGLEHALGDAPARRGVPLLFRPGNGIAVDDEEQ